MKGVWLKLFLAGVCEFAAFAGAVAENMPSLERTETRANAVPVGGTASVPYGWVDFCARNPEGCAGGPLSPVVIDLDARSREVVERINRMVNKSITAVSDAELWGVADRWDYPSEGKGDCEDYALLKRRFLIEEGFPRQALLMTVVKDGRNDGHAVLTVATSDGDYILDNLNDGMNLWDRTGYRFVKRQSQSDQNRWVQLGEPTSPPEAVSR